MRARSSTRRDVFKQFRRAAARSTPLPSHEQRYAATESPAAFIGVFGPGHLKPYRQMGADYDGFGQHDALAAQEREKLAGHAKSGIAGQVAERRKPTER